MNDQLLHAIRQRINYADLFGEFVDLRKGSGDERTIKCPFHEDTNPSMSLNVAKGVFLCHTPECGAKGDFIAFYQRIRSLNFKEALAELARRVGLDPEGELPPGPKDDLEAAAEALLRKQQTTRPEEQREIDSDIVTTYHGQLMGNDVLKQRLLEKRGLTDATLTRFHIGHDGKRYYIPILDEKGTCVNIRRYDPDAKKSGMKMISWRPGFGSARLFPEENFHNNEPLFLMEGEMDCLLANQLGLNAITCTGGAGTWRDDWNEKFDGKELIICYDVDLSGKTGAGRAAAKTRAYVKSVRIVTLPLTEPPGADFTNFIVDHGHNLQDFLRLVDDTSPLPNNLDVSSDEADEPIDVHLGDASLASYYNRPVRFHTMVSGKHTKPFVIPTKAQFTCSMPSLKMCANCPVNSSAGLLIEDIPLTDEAILESVGASKEMIIKRAKKVVGIPPRCTYVKFEALHMANVEHLRLIPEIDHSDEEHEYVTRDAYYLGHGLSSNRSYVMSSVMHPDPATQLVTYVVRSAIPAQSNIDSFQVAETTVRDLAVFQPDKLTVDGLFDRLDDIHIDLERVTRIYHRRSLLTVVDLVFHSVLRFTFQGEHLVRGWMEALIIGDSRTGKTTIVSRLMDHYGAGEFISAERTSAAGLVGGLDQLGQKTWVLNWGKIPLNDRRLVAIDEISSLPTEEISNMSAMRSSGIAEITKIHTEKTHARTRGIWISNPRDGLPLSSHAIGLRAVKQLIGRSEDIARFDLVVTAGSHDVALTVVNAERPMEYPETFTSTLCHQRVMWAWSRSVDQVEWRDHAERRVLALAMDQGKKYRYATEVPLVEPNEQRITIARLAVATAAMFFSASEDGQKVLVYPAHVEFAHEVIERIYNNPQLAFAEYAAAQKAYYEFTDASVIRLRGLFDSHERAVKSLRGQDTTFSQTDVSEIFSCDGRAQIQKVMRTLRETGFLKRSGRSGWRTSPAANAWMQQQLNGNEPSEKDDDLTEEQEALLENMKPPW